MLVDVLVSRPLPRWQLECLNGIAAVPGVVLRRRPVAVAPAGPLWRWIAGRCRMLAPSDTALSMEPDAATPADPADLVIDLAGADDRSYGQRTWKVLRDDGRPLAAPYPFARTWSRPGTVGSVFVVDECNRMLNDAHLATNGKFYTRMLDEVLRISALLPAQAVRNRLDGGMANAVPAGRTAVAHRGGAAARLAGVALRYAARRFRAAPRVEVWRIGLADQPIHAFLDEAAELRVEWLTRPEGAAYCADPFAHPDDPDEIWWERFDYHSRRGVLERARPRDGGARVRVALGVDVHLSYPFLTRLDGQVILIPEMSASGMTRLYRLGGDGQPEHLASLPVAGIDPILYRWGERYWLGLSCADIDARSNYCLWHAPDLTGPWTRHAGNPVKVDVRSARNAGTPFWHEGCLYRPAQDCSDGYGRSVVINRVLECTPRTYREEVAAVVRPQPHWPASQGLHTLSSCGGRTLIDAKAVVLNASGVWSKVSRFTASDPFRRSGPSKYKNSV